MSDVQHRGILIATDLPIPDVPLAMVSSDKIPRVGGGKLREGVLG
jgi:hypothetical protein